MAWKITYNSLNAGRWNVRMESDAAGGTSEWLPVREYEITVAAKPTAGTVRAEFTYSPIEVVLADTANATNLAIKKAWAPGDANAEAVDVTRRATAVRFVATNAAVAELAA